MTNPHPSIDVLDEPKRLMKLDVDDVHHLAVAQPGVAHPLRDVAKVLGRCPTDDGEHPRVAVVVCLDGDRVGLSMAGTVDGGSHGGGSPAPHRSEGAGTPGHPRSPENHQRSDHPPFGGGSANRLVGAGGAAGTIPPPPIAVKR